VGSLAFTSPRYDIHIFTTTTVTITPITNPMTMDNPYPLDALEGITGDVQPNDGVPAESNGKLLSFSRIACSVAIFFSLFILKRTR